MSNTDRLRAAAQMLEITGFLGVDADPLVKQRENLERNAIANLLLAVVDASYAEGHPAPLLLWHTDVWDAALVVADTILGDGDE